jgi:hypothetical protein
LKKEPLLSMLGNTTGGADATEMKFPLMNFPAPIPKMPPEDNFSFNEKGENINEGEDPPIRHRRPPLLAAEGVTIRRLERQFAEGTVSYFTAHEANEPKVYEEDLILKELVLDAIAFKATSNLDTLYLQEDMLAPYDAQFREAMKELNEHTRKGHCRVIRQPDVPHPKVLLMLWTKRQRRIETCKVSKPKARLILWGHVGVRSYQVTHVISI